MEAARDDALAAVAREKEAVEAAQARVAAAEGKAAEEREARAQAQLEAAREVRQVKAAAVFDVDSAARNADRRVAEAEQRALSADEAKKAAERVAAEAKEEVSRVKEAGERSVEEAVAAERVRICSLRTEALAADAYALLTHATLSCVVIAGVGSGRADEAAACDAGHHQRAPAPADPCQGQVCAARARRAGTRSRCHQAGAWPAMLCSLPGTPLTAPLNTGRRV